MEGEEPIGEMPELVVDLPACGMRVFRLALAALAVPFQSACFSSRSSVDQHASAAAYSVKREIRPIAHGIGSQLSASQKEYLNYYEIGGTPVPCRFGTFESGGLQLAAQFYCPPGDSRGTVIFVHGYLDHVGCGRHLINRLVAEGYHVAAYDHPGHGLSQGRRVSTKDFSIYEEAFADFVEVVEQTYPGPYDVVGHSMGGTCVVDHVLKNPSTKLRRMVLLAPLIEDATPKSLKRFGHLISPLVDYLPRFPEESSSDPSLAGKLVADPLQSRVVSTHWSRSFTRWQREQRIREPRPLGHSPLIISAHHETVIDREASNRWMGRAFPNGRFMMVEGSRHQLLNEAEAIREQVLGLICEELAR